LALALTSSAFAADAFKGEFQISAPTQINGKTLPAGVYTAKWGGTGNVQGNIKQGKKVVATVPGQVVDLEQVSQQGSPAFKSNSSGDRELTAIKFSGKKYSLDLGSESAKAQSKTDSAN